MGMKYVTSKKTYQQKKTFKFVKPLNLEQNSGAFYKRTYDSHIYFQSHGMPFKEQNLDRTIFIQLL